MATSYLETNTDFNPRLREGGDSLSNRRATMNTISIHASAREATSSDPTEKVKPANFNPRLREGGDLSLPE